MLIVLIAFILAVRMLATPNYISAAIERAENYSGICLAIDSNCSVGADQQVHLEDHPSLELSLNSHLLAAPVSMLAALPGTGFLSQAPNSHTASLPLWIFAKFIFHPPRR